MNAYAALNVKSGELALYRTEANAEKFLSGQSAAEGFDALDVVPIQAVRSMRQHSMLGSGALAKYYAFDIYYECDDAAFTDEGDDSARGSGISSFHAPNFRAALLPVESISGVSGGPSSRSSLVPVDSTAAAVAEEGPFGLAPLPIQHLNFQHIPESGTSPSLPLRPGATALPTSRGHIPSFYRTDTSTIHLASAGTARSGSGSGNDLSVPWANSGTRASASVGVVATGVVGMPRNVVSVGQLSRTSMSTKPGLLRFRVAGVDAKNEWAFAFQKAIGLLAVREADAVDELYHRRGSDAVERPRLTADMSSLQMQPQGTPSTGGFLSSNGPGSDFEGSFQAAALPAHHGVSASLPYISHVALRAGRGDHVERHKRHPERLIHRRTGIAV